MESGMISVDKWSSGSQAYFLTHLHADHTAGLSCTWRRGPLFCSPLTAKLFPCKFPGFDLSLLRILDIGCWHSLSLTTPSTGSATTVFVKAIDAHHCPGSVMYLFRGEFGCMLFTGDFRWETTGYGVENGRTMLLDALKNETLDTLYLDNTYCNPRYSFPSREVAAKQVVDIITSHPKHEVIIGIDSVGKEDLLLYISRALNIKIWVWPERLQIMHLLGFHENFTTQTSLTRVRAVPCYSFSIETLEGLNTLCPTIGVMPSGLPWAMKAVKGNGNLFGSSLSASCLKKENYSKDSTSCSKTHDLGADSGSAKRYHEYIYVVPYSDHSCFSEIQEFIELLRPVKIKGIVASSSCYIDPCYYFDHLCGTKQAFWRINRKQLENDEEICEVEAAEIKAAAQVTSTVTGRKRRIDQVDVFGIRVSRVSLLRRLGCGVKIADSEYYS
ncbi:5' exonuclease Apollo [Sesamum alatum]|uniref:Protein artemis n=1 Tax=Sesamum alatum TaxID=300844 RepID=A0AAE1XZT2_9LAMI|nr:5' exonuclease Apollo [Sesamum alatum]